MEFPLTLGLQKANSWKFASTRPYNTRGGEQIKPHRNADSL